MTTDLRRHLPLACIALSIVGCQSPTAPGLKVAIVDGNYVFACGSWAPSAPPVRRTLMDIGVVHGVDAPDAAAVTEIEVAGGRTVYRFHGNLVRVELDVATVRTLAGFPIGSGPILYALTVADPSSHSVRLAVMLDHNVRAQDLDALTALGGSIFSAYSFSHLVGIRIEDDRVPTVRALAGVTEAFIDGPTLCVQSPATDPTALVSPMRFPGTALRGALSAVRRGGTRERDLKRTSPRPHRRRPPPSASWCAVSY
jgi:hypothetical protein